MGVLFLSSGDVLRGQSATLNCFASFSPLVVRVEGQRELLGDIVLSCIGGNPVSGRAISPTDPSFLGPAGVLNGIPNQWQVQTSAAGSKDVPLVNITVSIPGIRIANRIFPGSNLTDAILLIDEPTSAQSGNTRGNQNPCYASAPLGLCSNMRYFFQNGLAVGAGYPLNPVPLDPNTGQPLSGYTAPTIPAFAGASNLAGNPIDVFQGEFGLGGGFAPNQNSITFVGVPMVQPGPDTTRIFRIKNIRAQLAGTSAVNDQIQAFVSFQNPPANLLTNSSSGVVGFVQRGLFFDTIAGPTYLQSAGLNFDPTTNGFYGPSSNPSGPASLGGALPSNTAVLRFNEAYGVAFKRRGFGGPLEVFDSIFNQWFSPGAGQAVPFVNYNNESGFYNSSFLNSNWRDSGVASTGTRLRAKFSGIPPGVRLYVSVAPINSTSSQNNFAYSTESILAGAPTAPNLPIGPPGGTSASHAAIGLSNTDPNGLSEGLTPDSNFYRTHPFPITGSSGFGFGSQGAAYAGNPNLNRTTQLTVASDGTATYTWEVLRTEDNVIDRFDFLVQAAFLPGTPTQNATIRVTGSLAPIATAASNGFPYAPTFLEDLLNQKTLFSITADLGPDPQSVNCGAGGRTLIGALDGPGIPRPMHGQAVVIEGLVTGVYQGAAKLNGFFLQDEGDGDPSTTDGIFVDESASNVAGTVAVGQRLRLRGTINSDGIRTTLSPLFARSCSLGNPLPQPVDITLPSSTSLRPFVGMLVRFPQSLRVTNTARLATHGEVDLAVVPAYIAGVNYTRLAAPTQVAAPGASALSIRALNEDSTITLDDGSSQSFAGLAPAAVWPQNGTGLNTANTLRLGSRVNVTNNTYTPLTAVLSANFNGFVLQPLLSAFPITFNANDNPRPAAPANVGGRVTALTVDLRNYFTTYLLDGARNQSEFLRQRDKLIAALKRANAAVVAVNGLENLAQAAIADLVNDSQSLGNSLNTGNPGKWAFIDTGVIGTANTRSALIYQPALVSPVGLFRTLTDSVDPRALSTFNQPAIAQTFRLLSGPKPSLQHFTVIAAQFSSRVADCPGDLFLVDLQASCNSTRTSMARALLDWALSNPTNDPTPVANRRFLLLGNLNSYLREDPIAALLSTSFAKPANGPFPAFPPNANATYRDLVDSLGVAADYSDASNGESGSLQHGLANPALFRLVTGVTNWHINADEPSVFDYQTDFRRFSNPESKSSSQLTAYYDASPFRSSDQDPLLIGFNPLPGDLDDDGDVDANDQAIMRAAIGKPLQTVDRRTDYDGDGRITLADFQRWSQFATEFLR